MAISEFNLEDLVWAVPLIIILSGGVESYINNIVIPFILLFVIIVFISIIIMLILWIIIWKLDIGEEAIIVLKYVLPLTPTIVAVLFTFLFSQLAIETLRFIGINQAEEIVAILNNSPFFYISHLGLAGLIYYIMYKRGYI